MYRNLHRMVIFSHVVDAGSFTGAAEVLGLSKSVVSHHVSELELSFGVKLLNRTTRRVSPTEFGRQFHLRCKEIDTISRLARDEAVSFVRQPLGTLTLQASHAVMGPSFSRLLAGFRGEFPGIDLRVLAQDEAPENCGSTADICVIVGAPGTCGQSLVPLWQHEDVLVASREYIENCRADIKPQTTGSLAYVGLGHDGAEVRRQFRDEKGDIRQDLEFRPTVRASTLPAVYALVRAGLGAAMLPRWMAAREIATGEIQPVLPGFSPVSGMVSAGHRYADNPPRNVTLFMDYISATRPSNDFALAES